MLLINCCQIIYFTDTRAFTKNCIFRRNLPRGSGCGYMTFAGGFAEANVAKPGALAEHVFADISMKAIPESNIFRA
jgi:hypothetical protein